jgi:SAM-dependent methyltransferase
VTESTPRHLLDDFLALVDDSCVAVLPHVLRIAAELDVAGVLATGPRTVEEIAHAVGADPDLLYRLVRALASVGMLSEEAPRCFRLTGSGHRLRADVAGSVRQSVLNVDSQLAWLRGLETVRAGRPAFDRALGDRFFAHKDGDADANRSFLHRMRERAGRLYPRFATATDWRQCGTVMDVGGGDGYQLERILRHAPHLDGVLFDRPAVVEAVRQAGNLAPFGDRYRLAGGDFFAALTEGADTHLLCSVLHDWTDDEAVAILRNSRSALLPGGRLMVVEMLVPPGDRWHPSKWSDLGMMVLTGGRERTATEFEELLGRADFTLSAVRAVPDSPFSVLEAK